MTPRTDWRSAYRELIAEGRERFPEPPTVEQLLALSSGELPPEEAARVEENLALYPELARVLADATPEPEEGLQGDPDLLPADLVKSDWQALLGRLAEPPAAAPASPGPGRSSRRRRYGSLTRWLRPAMLAASPARFWRLATAAAFASTLALGVLSLQERGDVLRLRRELIEPHLQPEHRLLLPDGVRAAGGEQPPIGLSAQESHFLLAASVAHLPLYPNYRLRIVELAGNRAQEIWSATGLHPRADTIEIWMPRAFIKSGREQRLEIYGLRDGASDLLATYTMELQDS